MSKCEGVVCRPYVWYRSCAVLVLIRFFYEAPSNTSLENGSGRNGSSREDPDGRGYFIYCRGISYEGEEKNNYSDSLIKTVCQRALPKSS
jgi:hypothetical protein